MAPANPTTRDIASDDELEAILNGETAVGDISATTQSQLNQNTQEQQKKTEALGLDKAIDVDQIQKRLPVPKLDDARLLSAAGIPKLRRISKERLRFKGKGHEVIAELLELRPHAQRSQYGDIARMLNMYQLWLDDLYPRAKFADGLAIIEKLGHSKRVQYMRKEWIAEGKPKNAESDPENNDAMKSAAAGKKDAERMEGVDVDNTGQENDRQIPGENAVSQQFPAPSREEDPDEDELDALLAESDAPQNSFTSTTLRPKLPAPEEENFEDDMAAMAEMEGMW